MKHYIECFTEINFTDLDINKEVEDVGTTRKFGRFSTENEEIYKFKVYLKSLDGKRRNEETAEAICRDISKYLFYCNELAVNWSYLKNRTSLLKYANCNNYNVVV